MSRLIKKPVIIGGGATVTEHGGVLVFKGPKGELRVALAPHVGARIEGENLWIEKTGERASKAILGTLWALSRNAVEGVTKGFAKILEIEGVGYRAVLEGDNLILYLGYAQPVRVAIMDGVTAAVEKNIITITGIDKSLVGLFAAKIRALKKPEPYKGKGIHYQGEIIRRKVGKKAGVTAS
jgi:large subunit ribosomal protein L6